MNPAAAKKPVAPEFPETRVHQTETDDRRRARLNLAHRKALRALACVTLRYQVHNELSAARRDSEAEIRESESRIRARGR
jgi:hypothetical protein